MKIMNICLLLGILIFYDLVADFVELGGMNYPLLKKLMQLIILLFFLILMKYQKSVKDIVKYDKLQKTIDDYLNK